jgi:hypothetical protein
MISSEEISLTIATLPFIVTFPMAFLLSVVLELYIPNILQVNIMLTVVVGILIFVRWVMAIVGE